MKKKIAIFGSTGSIGTQTLDVVKSWPDAFEITALAAGQNIGLLEQQIRQYLPYAVAVGNEEQALVLAQNITDLKTRVFSGPQGLVQLAKECEYDIMVMALVGNLGLEPVMTALERGIRIALATKEVLVAAGEVVMKKTDETSSQLLPVDSEHSAIFQCLQGENPADIDKIILTASGGPFRTWDQASLLTVTPSEALRHPNWNMGNKITIDSATLINKGLEVLEAKWLFSVPLDRIEVLVHPQSIIHSMVQFVDASVLAQLGVPDMKGPIQYALMHPQRGCSALEKLDLAKIGSLTFEEPDRVRFPGLDLAYEAGRAEGTMAAVFNAANEVAVDFFLKGMITFMYIPSLIDRVMQSHDNRLKPSLDMILAADRWARAEARSLCK